MRPAVFGASSDSIKSLAQFAPRKIRAAVCAGAKNVADLLSMSFSAQRATMPGILRSFDERLFAPHTHIYTLRKGQVMLWPHFP